jgi:vancomycin permeability regulator SanA
LENPQPAQENKGTQSVRRTLWKFTLRHKLAAGLCVLAGAALLWGPTVYANLSTRSLRYELTRTAAQNVPKKDVAIVFGAGVYPSGKPTPYLQWRVETAVELYKAERVSKVLMTGDNSRAHYNEPVAMGKLAERLGVPREDIVLDYAGFNTYDSCYRAKAIFEVETAILVTQGYHLPRAVMACNSLGVPSVGVNAEHTKGRSWGANYIVREWASTAKISVQLVFKPQPKLLGAPLPIKP